jgi:hypothetical protein
MYRFKFVFLTVLLLSVSAAHSQDYVLTSDGDTLRGKISALTSSSLKFKTDNKRTVKLSPEKVLRLSDNGTSYLSRQVYHKQGSVWRFLRLVDSGAVNLLTMDDGYSPSVSVSSGVFGGGGMMGGLGVSLGSGRGKSPAYYVEKDAENIVLKDVVTRFMAGDSRKQEVTETLLNVMGDIPEIADKINNTSRFTEKTLRDLVYDYNDISRL